MPTVLIWSPDEENKYGHAALQTSKYHMSFWPDGSIGKIFKTRDRNYTALEALDGIPACIVFHQDYDYILEGRRPATNQYNIVNATDEDINSVYEEFLHYNGINPKTVTLERAEELIEQSQDPTNCEVSLAKTKYSYVADLVRDKRKKKSAWQTFLHGANYPFYHEKQSCVSFCFNIIEMADPNPAVCYTSPRHHDEAYTGDTSRAYDHRVPWFENDIVKKYWLPGCKRSNNECIIS